jgi:hypothetical protein
VAQDTAGRAVVLPAELLTLLTSGADLTLEVEHG